MDDFLTSRKFLTEAVGFIIYSFVNAKKKFEFVGMLMQGIGCNILQATQFNESTGKFLKVCKFLIAIPSVTNYYKTDDRNRLTIANAKGFVQINHNYND